MSALINRVKEHISDNRGKYGAAAGAGAMYGASKIDSPLVNQAGFNVLANGQNLALDAAEKIDPRVVTKLNDLGMHKIRPEDIDASNALYNSGVAKFINPNPVDMVNANEHSTEAYNKAMALKADAQDALANAKAQGQDAIGQGVNFVKGLNPFTENTNFRGNTMKVEIKNLLLEGTNPEVIVEMAVHAGTVYEKGTALGKMNRPELAQSIKSSKTQRDIRRDWSKRGIGNDSTNIATGNYFDNKARLKSQMSKPNPNIIKDAPNVAATQQPRLYQAAKK